MPDRCQMCGRGLDVLDQPMSRNCGGDCFGCMWEIERQGPNPWYQGYGMTWAEWRAARA